MNIMDRTASHSIGQLRQALASGALTSESLVCAQLERIERFNGQLNAYVEAYPQRALGAAIAADRQRAAGINLGPLHGIPIAIKDLFEIDGKAITGGSLAQKPRISRLTATAVQRLERAGAIIMGKTHTVEFAFGGWGTNAVMGTPWNPWDADVHRAPGGSSSGSAVAVAGGLASAALGTDTGGSVRIPAGMCGLVGLKTTRGLISRHGLIELCPSLDSVGPITHTVEDAAWMLDALLGPDPLDPVSTKSPVFSAAAGLNLPVAGLRIWVLPQTERVHIAPGVLAAYDQGLEQLAALGMHLVEQPLPTSLEQCMRVAGGLMSAEGYASLGSLFERDDLRFDPHVQRRVLSGRAIDAAAYIHLHNQRRVARQAMDEAMSNVDACAFPTNAIGSVPLSQVDEYGTPLALLGRFANLLNLCSVALPVGFDEQRMPVSMQIVGRAFAETLVLRIAHAYQQVSDWHQLRPAGWDLSDRVVA
ncbi:amidase [Pseudomonas thivervalensis]|uniref:amidase n=1 Tax=Pseudomonas thivervalensis TaxID=86265 RepID=UPI00069E7DD1|nr:amidase [Pseudomonas thivervalensis]OAB52893.1 glutamyl-tRNA amidotransferase [Pseudomonas thivervalensis]SDG16057.1 aspartyl-tRNA(Asn)/glutamyl-tRNA(Gln) amidotransferase subunit A [Pseudomonas thivervalensis]